MGVCSRCGTQNDGTSVFCPACGAVQTPAGPPGQPPVPPPAPGWGAPVPPPQPGSYAPRAPQAWAQPGGWTAQQTAGGGWEDEQEFDPTPEGRPPGQRDPKLLLLALGIVGLVVVAGVVAFLLLSRHGRTGAPAAASSSASAPASSAASSSAAPGSSAAPAAVTATPEAQPPAGAAPVPLVAVGADCTYPPSVDGKNQPVTYEPAKAVDADATTAWRCPGAGGHTIRLTLGRPGPVSDLGLIPGYAKVDPASGVNRFTDNHTVTQVAWQLEENGQQVRITQDIADPGPELAWVHLSRPVAASSISLTVTAVGNMGARQDSTPISTITVAGGGQPEPG